MGIAKGIPDRRRTAYEIATELEANQEYGAVQRAKLDSMAGEVERLRRAITELETQNQILHNMLNGYPKRWHNSTGPISLEDYDLVRVTAKPVPMTRDEDTDPGVSIWICGRCGLWVHVGKPCDCQSDRGG